MNKTKKDKFLITRVASDFKDRFYKKCKQLKMQPSDKLRELAEKFLK